MAPKFKTRRVNVVIEFEVDYYTDKALSNAKEFINTAALKSINFMNLKDLYDDDKFFSVRSIGVVKDDRGDTCGCLRD